MRQRRLVNVCVIFYILQKYGWKILFRGSWMLVMRAIPINAATFVGYEYALDRCHYLTSPPKSTLAPAAEMSDALELH